jgi:hypothetical protein
MTTEPSQDPADKPKKKRLSGCLIAVIIAVLLPIVLVVTAVAWWKVVGHEYFEELRVDAAALAKEGKAFGQGKQADDCIAHSVAASSANCSMFDTMCVVKQGSFLRGCLRASTDYKQRCASVPEMGNVLNTWEVDTCKALGQPDKLQCTLVLQEVRRVCERVRDGVPAR